MPKIHRHVAWSSSTPPATGPIVDVMAVKADHVPIALPRASPSKVALSIARLAGASIVPPAACSTRAAMSAFMEFAKAHASDPIAKIVTPVTKMRLRP